MNPRPEGMPWLTPYLTVADAARALDFYAAAFGFGRGEVVEDKGQVVHAGMTHNGEVIVMFGPESCSERLAHTPANGGFESRWGCMFMSRTSMPHTGGPLGQARWR